MFRQLIHVHRYHWDVVVFYESGGEDAPYILRTLEEAGAGSADIARAARNLQSGMPDTGLTYSNEWGRVSVVVLSHASSRAEFANTWFHEVFHCAKHIARFNGLDCDGEPVAYVGGELAREMQPVAARLMCPTCKH